MIAYCQQVDCKNETAYHRAELSELLVFADSTYLIKKYVELLSVTLFFVAQAIVFGLVYRNLKCKLTNVTPFTEKGAAKLKEFGIQFLSFPPSPPLFRKPQSSWKGVKTSRCLTP